MIRWIHISDIHYNYSNYSNEKMRSSFINSIEDYVKDNGEFDFIVVTGDIVYKGGEYDEQLVGFFNKLILVSGIDKENLFMVPGNHDIKRSGARNRLIRTIVSSKDISKEVEELDEESFEIISSAQEGFWDFYKCITGKDANRKSIHFIEEREKFNIISINTSLLCCMSDEEGKLSIFLNKLYETLHNNIDKNKINIAIGHHNIECFYELERNKIINNFVDEGIDLYLCGHSHRPKFSIDNSNNENLYIIMSGAGVVDDYAKTTYLIGNIVSGKCTNTYYSWDKVDEVWTLETKGLGRIVKNGTAELKLKKTFNVGSNDKKNEHEFYLKKGEKVEKVESGQVYETILEDGKKQKVMIDKDGYHVEFTDSKNRVTYADFDFQGNVKYVKPPISWEEFRFSIPQKEILEKKKYLIPGGYGQIYKFRWNQQLIAEYSKDGKLQAFEARVKTEVNYDKKVIFIYPNDVKKKQV